MSKVLLSDLIPEAVTVNVGRGSVEVFGISIEQVGPLLEVLAKAEKGGVKIDETMDVNAMVAAAPDLADMVIAMAIKCEDQMDSVKRIPLASKIEILMTTWRMSVPDPKGLGAILQSLKAELVKAKESLNDPSQKS